MTTTTTTCSFEWSGYPSPGATEFGEPDHFECRDAATWRVFFPQSGPYDPDGTVLDFCSEHVMDPLQMVPNAESVMLRDLPDITCGSCHALVWVLHPGIHTSPCVYCALVIGLPKEDHPNCSCPEEAAYNAAMEVEDNA